MKAFSPEAEAAGKAFGAVAGSVPSFDRTPINIIMSAVDNLRAQYAELLCVLPSEEEWSTRVSSWARLNIPANHHAAAVSDSFVAQYYLEVALLTLLDSGSLIPVIRTNEAEQDIAKLRKSIGAYRRALFNEEPMAEPAEQPQQTTMEPPVPSEEELDAQIVNDWATLHVSEIRSKLRDAAYKGRFDRLMSAGRLGR